MPFSFLEALGCASLCCAGIKFTKIFYPYVFRKSLKELGTRYNRDSAGFALVTGGTDGIGKMVAKELARNNVNVIVLGRNEQKLATAIDEIHAVNQNVKVQPLLQDLNCAVGEILDHPNTFESKLSTALLSTGIKDAHVSILVNNAGVTCVSRLTDMSQAEVMSIVSTNITSPVAITKSIVSRMKSEEESIRKNDFAVLNIGSITGEIAPAYLSMYAGSKAFLMAYGKSLHSELAGEKVTVTTMCPFYISTRMTRFQKVEGFSTISQDEFVAGSLNALLHGQAVSAGSWRHEVIRQVLGRMPRRILDGYFEKQMAQPLKIRQVLLRRSNSSKKTKKSDEDTKSSNNTTTQ